MIKNKISNGIIYQGDCLEVMKSLPDESFKVIVTSPPYNIRNSTGGGFKGKSGGIWKNSKLNEGYDGYNDNLPHDVYVQWQRDCLTEMMRLLRPDGAIFYNHKKRVQKGLEQDRYDILKGFPLRQTIIWDRCGGINFNDTYFLPTNEDIYFIAKPECRLVEKGNKVGTVWRFPPEAKNEHPASFPIELPQRCISAIGSGPVLDPFIGSGTTAIAAEKLGYEWVGIESSQEYIDQALKRIKDYIIAPSLL